MSDKLRFLFQIIVKQVTQRINVSRKNDSLIDFSLVSSSYFRNYWFYGIQIIAS